MAVRATHSPAHIRVVDAASVEMYRTLRLFVRGAYAITDDERIRRLDASQMMTGDRIDGVTRDGFTFIALEAPSEMDGLETLRDGRFRAAPSKSGDGLVMRHMMVSVFSDLERGDFDPALPNRITTLFALFARGMDHARETDAQVLRAARLQAMTAYIDAHLDEPELGAARLATVFGLSRATLFRIFEPEGGVLNAIASRRLARAMRALIEATPQRGAVARIAAQAGFHDASHFNTAFRRHVDIAPSDLLGVALARGGPDQTPSRSPFFGPLAELYDPLVTNRRSISGLAHC